MMTGSRLSNRKKSLMSGVVGSFGIKLISMVLSLGLAVCLARTLGPEDFGIYSFVFSLVSLLAMPAQFGLPTLTLRETARYHSVGKWSLLLGIWRWSFVLVLLISLALLVGTLGVIWVVPSIVSDTSLLTLYWGLALVPLVALNKVVGAAMRGLRHIVLGQLPQEVLRPLVFLVLVGFLFMISANLSAHYVMALHVLAAAFSLLVGFVLLSRVRPSALYARTCPIYQTRPWLSAILPLAFVAGIQQLMKQTDIITLGVFTTSAATVGIYRVAVQGATLLFIVQSAFNLAIAPYIARWYVQKDYVALQHFVSLSAFIGFVAALIAGAVFLIIGEEIVNLLFGSLYISATQPLSVLAVGHIINSFFGSPGLLLNMTGHEKLNARAVAIATGVNLLLNILFIPMYGMIGAAVATSAALILWQFLLWREVRNHIHIDSMAIRLLSLF